MTSESAKIVHFSDLHICTAALRKRLEAVCAEVARTLPWIHGNLVFAEQKRLAALRARVVEFNPDVICLSGDLSAFGDLASLRLAGDFLASLHKRPAGGRRIIVTVPGNHDSLAAQYRRLLTLDWRKLPWHLRGFAWAYAAPIRQALRSLPPDAPARVSREPDALTNYWSMAREHGQTHHSRPVNQEINGIPLVIAPFNTVSRSPIWMNHGDAPPEEFGRLQAVFGEDTYRPDAVRIALMHHNPLSSPEVVQTKFVHAYNSMPGGSKLLRELQAYGVDLLLHGHQHQWNEYALDFFVRRRDRLHVLGVPGAAFGEPCGFNTIEILPTRSLQLTRYEYRDGRFMATPRPEPQRGRVGKPLPLSPEGIGSTAQ